MRYVEDSDLAQLLREEAPLEPERALDLVGRLADARDAAHARDARRAVSMAIDRDAAVAALGGASAARATCHILPPSSAGYRPDCPERDLEAARRLVRRSGTRGARVTLWSGAC